MFQVKEPKDRLLEIRLQYELMSQQHNLLITALNVFKIHNA